MRNRYGRDYIPEQHLTEDQLEIAAVLIAREITAPSRPPTHYPPEDEYAREIGRRILFRPESHEEVSIRADAIHAMFGITELLIRKGVFTRAEPLGTRRLVRIVPGENDDE